MANVIYSAITSLDGYVEDSDNAFDWAAPDEEVHTFVNHLERSVGTYLYGRRMYETMLYWETAQTVPDQPMAALDFAEIWQAADKVVYSQTLNNVSSARTRIERDLNPEAVLKLKSTAVADITVGGAATCRPGHPGRVGRRAATPPCPCRRGRRQASLTRQRAPRAGTARRTTLRRRCRLPPLQHRTLRGATRASSGWVSVARHVRPLTVCWVAGTVRSAPVKRMGAAFIPAKSGESPGAVPQRLCPQARGRARSPGVDVDVSALGGRAARAGPVRFPQELPALGSPTARRTDARGRSNRTTAADQPRAEPQRVGTARRYGRRGRSGEYARLGDLRVRRPAPPLPLQGPGFGAWRGPYRVDPRRSPRFRCRSHLRH